MSGRGQPGYGRGGRGAALLELISDPARKPGQQPQQPQQQRSSPTLQQEYAGRGAVSSVGRASAASGVPQPAPVGRGLASLLHQVKTEQQQQQSQGAIPKKPLKTSPEPAKDVSPTQVTSPGPSSPMGRGISAFLRHGQPTSPTAGGDASVLESPRQSIPVGRGLTGLSMGRGLASPVEKTRPHIGSGDAPLSPVEPRAKTPPQVAAPKTPPKTPTPSPEPQPPTEELKQLKVQEKVEKVSKSGTAGQPVPIACNYIRMKCKFEAVYQYAVSFTPQVDSKSMRFRLVNEHRDVIGAVKAFDGAMLFLPIRLNEPITVMASKRPTDGSEVVVRVTLTKVLRPEECIQPYNVIFRKIMRILDMKQVARHYYDPNRAVSVPQHKLEIWPGYITSLREYEGGLLLLADVSHKVLRNENVLDFMYKIYQKNPKSFKDECTRQLVGNIVLTRYNNKTYRIDDIAWDKNPQSTFSYGHQGEEMTFVDYYLKAYNKKINDLEQPLLINHPKRKAQEASSAPPEVICLIPELSSLTGLTDEMRQDFRVMKDVASHTRVSPTQRALAMRSFMDSIKSSPEATAELSKWGLELDNDILKSQGRALPPEKIIFQTKSVMANQEADWGRDLTRESVICPVNLQCWMVVFTRRDANKAMDFIQMMKKVCPSMGIRVNEPVQLELQDDRTETYLRTIRESINTQIQMVVVIFPTSRDDRYNAIKKLCCVESPVPSQVIIARTISQQQKLRSVTQKVALQINCKLGGELWALDIPLKKLMVVGIDVYHDAAHGGKSVGAMVASTNFKLTRWYSRVCFQLPQQELIDGLKLCLTSALRKYHEVNHTLPDRVVVFRDGVGDGQLRVVSGYEVDQLKECFTHFGSTYDPKMAVVVVQKRINTRIFGDFHGQLDNPKPGLVLDHTVTMCNWYDYFLVSQHVRQGTVSPTHYVVVYDGSGLKPDHMQRLSYKLTHLYYNWPGTVRVPAPCQYAHKLAYLVGQNIRREPSQDLADRLFFL